MCRCLRTLLGVISFIEMRLLLCVALLWYIRNLGAALIRTTFGRIRAWRGKNMYLSPKIINSIVICHHQRPAAGTVNNRGGTLGGGLFLSLIWSRVNKIPERDHFWGLQSLSQTEDVAENEIDRNRQEAKKFLYGKMSGR